MYVCHENNFHLVVVKRVTFAALLGPFAFIHFVNDKCVGRARLPSHFTLHDLLHALTCIVIVMLLFLLLL